MLPILTLLSLLPLLVAIQAQLAGNEHYAVNSRRLLTQHLARKRWSPSPLFGPESVSFSINGIEYISPTGAQFKAYELEPDWGLAGSELVGKDSLVTVMGVNGEVTCDVLGKQVEMYEQKDDVWSNAFMQSVIFTSTGSYHVAPDVAGCVRGWGGSTIIKSGNATSDVKDVGLAHVKSLGEIPPGPYVAKVTPSGAVRLTEVYRMYRDQQQAFTTASIHTTNNTFVDLAVPVPGLNTLSIPVPSRLYTAFLADPRPLEGLRIAVKDLFDMAGLVTGGGSRAYAETYPAREKTAFSIQKLVDQGAIVVGRSKTSQYANGESATADWVDQMCPFNPRGDGYQQPSSSSSGSGAAIGAYDWLDNTIGSDTGGSITGPAGVQGVYGLRPTWGAISLEGVIPLQATQDTAGFFDRSAVRGAAFAKGWYGDKFKTYAKLPSTLIFPSSDWTFAANSTYGPIFTQFRTAVSTFANATVDTGNFNTYWNATGRFERFNGTWQQYTTGAYGALIGYYQYQNFGKPWIEDYKNLNNGRAPFISPSPLIRWAYGRDNVTQAGFEAAAAKKQEWQNFITQDVLQSDATTCSRAIYFEPNTVGSTSYRNVYRQPAGVPLGAGYVAPFAGIPQLVIPLGQVPYQSTITNQTEYLPVTVSLYAAAGCDYILWDLAAKLEEQGITKAVKAGRTAY